MCWKYGKYCAVKIIFLKDHFLNTVWFPPSNRKIYNNGIIFYQMVQAFARCILCSKDEIDLDELLAAKLVSFLMDNYQDILSVPSALKSSIEEHIVHLQRVQVGI